MSPCVDCHHVVEDHWSLAMTVEEKAAWTPPPGCCHRSRGEVLLKLAMAR